MKNSNNIRSYQNGDTLSVKHFSKDEYSIFLKRKDQKTKTLFTGTLFQSWLRKSYDSIISCYDPEKTTFTLIHFGTGCGYDLLKAEELLSYWGCKINKLIGVDNFDYKNLKVKKDKFHSNVEFFLQDVDEFLEKENFKSNEKKDTDREHVSILVVDLHDPDERLSHDVWSEKYIKQRVYQKTFWEKVADKVSPSHIITKIPEDGQQRSTVLDIIQQCFTVKHSYSVCGQEVFSVCGLKNYNSLKALEKNNAKIYEASKSASGNMTGYIVKNFLQPEQADVIVQSIENKHAFRSLGYRGKGALGQESYVTTGRSSHEFPLTWLGEENRAYTVNRVHSVVSHINKKEALQFDLSNDIFHQIVRYEKDDHFDNWHIDLLSKQPERKYTMVCLLSEPGVDFEGAEFKLWGASHQRVSEMRKGDAIIFPTYLCHKLTPVTSGTRYVIICRVMGNRFK